MKAVVSTLAALALGLAAVPARADEPPPPLADNGLVRTPPMGWNSWNKFACNVDEALIRKTADAIAASGMKDAGYEYVVIDDCWQGERDAQGYIQPDAKRFPSGMKALGDYIHSRGLKFGIYSDAGLKTCGGRPGSWGHEYQDARQYAAWGVDYLKYDWCMAGGQHAPSSYYIMSRALQETGRDIVLSICEWGGSKPWLWGPQVGNLWRTTGDIYDAWEGVKGYSMGVMNILDRNADLHPYARPGHWNDPDMLEVGNGGMTTEEYRAHFSLWAMLAAPLIAGNDVSAMDADTKAILTNREVIAIDQDPLGVQARRVSKQGDLEVWARPLQGGGRAVVLLNRGKASAPIRVDWAQLDYPAGLKAKVRDLWAAKDLGTMKGGYQASVASHGVVMLTVQP
ncbi:MAG: glycoside hydrolase family 27 protein [Caulobacter sp.]|nr:glycoside hydrolase family 27 protein [Caulobacter sp.]